MQLKKMLSKADPVDEWHLLKKPFSLVPVYNQSESRAQEKHYNTKSKVDSKFLQLL
jgi:hypothetical protein